MTKTPADVLSLVNDEGYEFIDLRFCDLPGQVQHFTVPVRELTEDSFQDGFGFDGSSIRGFQEIQESDMLLIPDPTTAVDDVFRERKTLILYCFVNDPVTGAPYDRDPRYVAKKAEEYLKSTGIAETSYWGPEAEFYIFDDVRYGQNQYSGFYYVDSVEGAWNSGEYEEGGNLGYKPRYKEGYFPVPPTDHFQDLRSEMTANLEAAGIRIEVQHHEVGTAGQAEIDMRYDTLLRTADNVTLYKYIVKNTAWAAGKTVTFMPKPIFEDNGSGMHTHQSLWNGGHPAVLRRGGLRRPVRHGPVVHRRPAEARARRSWRLRHRPRTPITGWCLAMRHRSTWCTRAGTARRRSASRSTRRRRAAKRLEFRCPDPSCNPYLSFAAMLMAGLDGVQNRIEPHDPVDKDIYDLPPAELAGLPSVPGASPRRSRPSRTTTSSCSPVGCSART